MCLANSRACIDNRRIPCLTQRRSRTSYQHSSGCNILFPGRHTFSIQETFNAEMDAAMAINKQAAATLVKAIKNLGIEEKDIQTDNLQVDIA